MGCFKPRSTNRTSTVPLWHATSPLVGDNAAITSCGWCRSSLTRDDAGKRPRTRDIAGDEQALSRQKSPFRSVDALADYVLELTGAADQTASAAN